MKTKPKYSGNDSRKFWKKINKIDSDKGHGEAYLLGCLLQETEAWILDKLKHF